MPDLYMDVDIALSEVPVNILALTDDTDFKTRETGIVYNQAGMDLVWNFITTAGVYTQTAVTPTTEGDYDWSHQGDGMYSIEIPASGGASINNDTEGVGWFTGICTGVLPWRGPTIGFRAAGLNNLLIDSAYSATRGLAGTALPAAAADAAGGLPISDAGGLDIDTQLANTHEITAARMGALTDWINGGRLDLILDIIAADVVNIDGSPMVGTNNAALAATALSTVEWTAARAAYLDELEASNIPADVDSILEDTGTTLPANQTLIYDRIGSPAGADIAADIATRSSHTAADIWAVGARTLTSFGTLVADIWNTLTSALTTVGSIGKLLVDNINATITSRSTLTASNVKSEVDDALTDIHLDHLLAVDYDPASKPGTATALLNELIESDGGVSRYTANALEQAPSGTGGDATEAKQDTIITHLTEVKGAGFIESTDSNEAIRNRGDAAWGGSAASYVGAQGGQLLNFRVNEKSGSFVYDKIHSDYKGILEDGVTFEEGVKGKSLTFDGSGSVKCQQNFDEKRYSGNPVIPTLTGAGGAYAPYGLYDPSILFVGDEIWIYYSAVGDDGHVREGLSISSDGGLTFEDYGMVLDVGAEGEWDDWKAHDVDVLYDEDDSTYKMWYNGNLLPDNPGKIGLATSPDGKVWTKYAGNPVFDVDVPGSWDDTGVNYPTVIKEDGIFYMWYGGYNSVPEYGGMGLATSPDGITWTRVQATPVLPSNDFHKYTVTKQNNVYYVIFVANNSYQQLAMGYSTDRLNWTVNYHPVIQLGESLEWDSIVIEDADFYFDGTDAKIYYSGATVKGQNNQIGLITIEDLEEKVQKAEILNQYPISICCWIKTTQATTPGGGIIRRGLDSEYDVFCIYLSGGRLKAYYAIDSNNNVMMTADVDDGGIINDGLWHHIIFIVDASGGELFVDLISKNTKVWTGTPGATTSIHLMEIGESNGNILIGNIDDVRIYDHALSSDERRGIYMGVPYLEDNTLENIRDQESTQEEIEKLQGVNFDPTLHSNIAIRDKIDSAELTGSNAITINIKDQNADNVVECVVEIWDQANTVFYERKITNSNGDTSHNIDNGTYTVRIYKAGYIFSDKTLIVTDAEIVNYTGTTVIIGTPAAADACRVYDFAFQSDGLTPVETIDASCFISALPYDYSGKIYSGERRDAIYDTETGKLYWDLVRGSTVKFNVKYFGYINKAKPIPDSDQARLTDL